MATEKKIRTVEKTGKIWKLQQLLAAGLLIGGIVALIGAHGDPSPWAGMAVGVGLLWLIAAKIGAWWCHG